MTPLPTAAGGVTLIGGGSVEPGDLALALAHAPCLVAADGGADAALAAGLMPEMVIGDLDSISPTARARLADRLHPVAEQDSTDFEKCLQRIAAPHVIAVGFAGRRLDHTLAALSVIARRPGQRILMLAEAEVVFLAPPQLRLDIAPGLPVSLFPMGPVRGTSTGLVWPIDGLDFAPDARVGTSNEASGPVMLTTDGPLLVMVPKACLPAVLAALA